MHDEGCAGSKRALDCQTAAVPVEHMLDQRQPQPGAALRATVRYIDAVKTLCEPRQVFRGDARTVVAYRYARLEPYGMPILIGLIVLMVAYQPLGAAFGGLMQAGNNFFYSLFGLQ